MTEKIFLIVLGYLVLAFALGVLLGKMIKRNNPCQHEWVVRGYGGAGWTLSVCKWCGEREIDPS